MIPFTFPSSPSLVTGNAECKVWYLSSVTGLMPWKDYIPVRTFTSSSPVEGKTDANGYQAIKPISSTTGLAAWSDYIPVYEVSSGTAWSTDNNGYIPVGAAGSALSLTFAGASALDSRITFTRASNAWNFDSTGRLVTAGNNVPRFDYDPATPAGVTGGELVTNGTFDNGTTGWIISGGSAPYNVTAANGALSFAGSASFINVSQVFGVTGKTYQVTYTISSRTAGQVRISMCGTAGTYRNSAGTYTENIAAGSNTGAGFIVQDTAGTFVGTIDNISVQEVTFTPRGFLIEEQRTNLLLSSRDMRSAAAGNPITAWTNTDVTPARTQVGIDGTANSACLMTQGVASSALVQNSSHTNTNIYTASFVLKRGNNDWQVVNFYDTTSFQTGRAWFNLSTGIKGSTAITNGATNVSSTITPIGGGWYRCTLTAQAPTGGATCSTETYAVTADSALTRSPNATYIVDCAQLEVGAFATSIIITGAATVTRSADSASMTGTNFSSWYSQTQGTFVVDMLHGANDSASHRVLDVNDGSQLNAIQICHNPVGVIFAATYINPNTDQTLNAVGSLAQGVAVKAALAYESGTKYLTRDGLTVGSNSLYVPSSGMTQMVIGARFGNTSYINGHIRRIQYYPTRLPNATLQALTTA